MKTLVIHPFDISTQFLSVIYADKDWTIISTDCSRRELKEQIKAHDRIIMMGHGDQNGLFGHGHFMITKQNVYYLKQKQCVFIWCNADVFVRKYHLTGLYTGMIISEWEEAIMYAIYRVTIDFLIESNTLFASTIAEYIDIPDRLERIKTIYSSDSNPIIQFNSKNIFER